MITDTLNPIWLSIHFGENIALHLENWQVYKVLTQGAKYKDHTIVLNVFILFIFTPQLGTFLRLPIKHPKICFELYIVKMWQNCRGVNIFSKPIYNF